MIGNYILFLLNRFKGYIFTNALLFLFYLVFLQYISTAYFHLLLAVEPGEPGYQTRMLITTLMGILAYPVFNVLYSLIYLNSYRESFLTPLQIKRRDPRDDYVRRHPEPLGFREDLVSHMREQGWFDLAAYGVFCLITLLVMLLPSGGIFNPVKAFLGVLNYVAIINIETIPTVLSILLAWICFALNYILAVPLIHRRWQRWWTKQNH